MIQNKNIFSRGILLLSYHAFDEKSRILFTNCPTYGSVKSSTSAIFNSFENKKEVHNVKFLYYI